MMNNFNAVSESSYRKRWISSQVQSAVNAFPVVIVTGARQVGKSTLLQHEFPDFKYVSLDDFSALQQARTDPASLWVGADRIIIDEAQKSPELFSAIKAAVDADRQRRRFILSGSSNILLMQRISETLAGRAVYFDMLPMAAAEMAGETKRPDNFFELWKRDPAIEEGEHETIDPVPFMLRGFMPPLIHLKERRDVLLWWEGYVRTYLERDVRELTRIDSLVDFKKTLDSLALRTGNVLNQSDVSRDAGVSQPTVHRYLKSMEVSNIINRVPAYYHSRSKRITKAPKLFFVDTALSIYLSGYYDEDALRSSREVGNFFETMVYMHVKIASELMVPKPQIFYWRTTAGKEVDFVVEHGRNLLAFEVKLTRSPSFNDIKNLLLFLEENPQTTRGILLHAGSTVQWLHSKVLAVPWWWPWK